MAELVVRRADGDDDLREWQRIHNLVIPRDPLSMDEVRERSTRNLLDVACLGPAVIGCSTVRPATHHVPVTVIVRIEPEHRQQGHGGRFLDHVLLEAAALGAVDVQTIVYASNADGLAFAQHRGFVESDRYVLDGDTVPYVHLTRRLREDRG